MSENAELWTYPDEISQRRSLINWLISHNVKFDKNMSIYDLAELYRDKECGKI